MGCTVLVCLVRGKTGTAFTCRDCCQIPVEFESAEGYQHAREFPIISDHFFGARRAARTGEIAQMWRVARWCPSPLASTMHSRMLVLNSNACSHFFGHRRDGIGLAFTRGGPANRRTEHPFVRHCVFLGHLSTSDHAQQIRLCLAVSTVLPSAAQTGCGGYCPPSPTMRKTHFSPFKSKQQQSHPRQAGSVVILHKLHARHSAHSLHGMYTNAME